MDLWAFILPTAILSTYQLEETEYNFSSLTCYVVVVVVLPLTTGKLLKQEINSCLSNFICISEKTNCLSSEEEL